MSADQAALTLLPFALLLAVAGLGSIMRGGPVERRGVVLLTVAWLASLGAQIVSGEASPGPWLLLIDGALMTALIALTWKSPRPWPAAACGFQAIAIAVAVASWLDPDMEPHIHLSLLALAGYGAAAALTVGAWLPPKPRRG